MGEAPRAEARSLPLALPLGLCLLIWSMETCLPLTIHSFSRYLLDIHDTPASGTGNTAGNAEAHSPYLPGVLSWGGRQTAGTLMNTAEPLRTRPRAPPSSGAAASLWWVDWLTGTRSSPSTLARREFPAASTAVRYLPSSVPTPHSYRLEMEKLGAQEPWEPVSLCLGL